jgi:protein involved in polysaccharide export with SLBB domain
LYSTYRYNGNCFRTECKINFVFIAGSSGGQNNSNHGFPAPNLSVQNNAALLQQSEKEPTVIMPSPQTAKASSDYLVTAGDIYELSYAAGTVPVTCTIPVNVSYKIRVANLATLCVCGKTFLQIKNQVEEIFTKIYPLGGAQFVLLTPDAFKVTIKGEVQQTTVKQAWTLLRLSSLVNDLRTDCSSLRNVGVQSTTGENYASLIRKNKEMFSAVSDTQHAYIIRDEKIIPINMNRILHDASYYTSETVHSADTLMVPFRQYFVSVSGAVENQGRYPYIPDRDRTYYVGLAGGFSSDKNSFNSISITDINGRHLKKTDPITPETNILAQTNLFTFYFSKYAPVLTTILSSLSTIFTIYAVTH